MNAATLSFSKAMSNSPSDLICDDNSLALSLGVAFENGEYKAIQKPVEVGTTEADILFIHDFAGYTHYIGMLDGDLVYYDKVGDAVDFDDPKSISVPTGFVPQKAVAIGNTVVMNTSTGLAYFLWKSEDRSYLYLGGQLPEIELEVGLDDVKKYDLGEEYEADITSFTYDDHGARKVIPSMADAFKNACVGIVAKSENKVKKDGHFLYPFWLRVAYRLYDGTNAMITTPILVMPTVRYNRYIVTNGSTSPMMISFHPYAGDVVIQITNSISGWEDIISGVDVFVSESVRGFEMDGEYSFIEYPAGSTVYADYINDSLAYNIVIEPLLAYSVIEPEQRTDASIIKSLIESSVFYKVLELDPSDLVAEVNLSTKMEKNVLNLLTTQTALEHDDFYGHCPINPGTMLAYNGRLQLADIKRGFYDGARHHIVMQPSTRTADVYFKIQTNSGTRIVKQEVENDAMAYWLYYPDPRAKFAYLVIGGNKYTLALTQHPFLNGAYYFGSLPSLNNDALPTADADSTAPTVKKKFEVIPNTIITSDVNNPFVYNSDGSNDVGSGKIYAIVPNTTALSEGQFGAYPLYAFTSEGIWALGVNKEGLYDEVKPLPREVLLNPEGLVQTDSAVFFLSKKGLMFISGSKAQCVSTQLSGKTADLTLFGQEQIPDFMTFAKDARLAYDYRNSRIWMYNEDSDYVFIYSYKYNSFAMQKVTSRYKRTLNLYPETILQDASGALATLDTPDINADPGSYSGVIVSRPVKFGSILRLKTIQQLELHYYMRGDLSNNNRRIKLKIYASDGLSQVVDGVQPWTELTELGGRPWKYYVFKITLSGLSATETFAGLTALVEEKHTHRLYPESEITDFELVESGPWVISSD